MRVEIVPNRVKSNRGEKIRSQQHTEYDNTRNNISQIVSLSASMI